MKWNRIKLLKTPINILVMRNLLISIVWYNDICKTKLQKPLEEYQTINKNYFNGYDQKLKNEMLSAAYRSEHKDWIFLVKLTTAYQTFCQKHLNYR